MPPDAANRNDLSMVDGTAAGPASRPQVSSAGTSNSRFCAAPRMHIDTIGTAIDLRCASKRDRSDFWEGRPGYEGRREHPRVPSWLLERVCYSSSDQTWSCLTYQGSQGRCR